MLRMELMDIINECEKKYSVNDWKTQGINIWPIIRNKIFFDNADEYISICSSFIDKTKLNKYVNKIKIIIIYLIEHLIFLVKNSLLNNKHRCNIDAVFLSDGVSFNQIKKVWYEKNCDPIIEALKENNISSVLLIKGRKYRYPLYSNGKYIQPSLDYYRILLKKYLIKSSRNTFWHQEYFKMGEHLKKCYKTINIAEIANIEDTITIIRRMSSYFKKVITRNNIKVGLLDSYYSIEGMAFILACNELGIKSIDIQHGFQGDLHVAYGRWKKVPKNGYALLPKIFWCWSEYESNCIEEGNNDLRLDHRAIIVGNPSLELWKNNEHSIVKYYDQRISEIKGRKENYTHILYTLEGHKAIDRLEIITNLILNTSFAYHWWIRLHPGFLDQKKSIKEYLRKKNVVNYVELNAATEFPLYALLRNIDVHVTTFSSTVIEAEAFGVPSVIIDKLGTQLFNKQVASGWAVPAYESESILLALKDLSSRKKTMINQSNNSISKNIDVGIESIKNILNSLK